MLTALELVCFAAVSLGIGIASFAAFGVAGGAAGVLIAGGASGVYLVNAYSMPVTEEADDAELSPDS